MSNCILILGNSGSGKSTSLRNLPPAETYLINVLGKALPFQGSTFSENSFKSGDVGRVAKCLKHIDEKLPTIKNIVIDDFGYLMTFYLMDTALEKGYDKFSRLGKMIWDLILFALSLRDDLNIYFIGHSKETPAGLITLKTVGKMLDDQVVIEGLFTVVLHAVIADNRRYAFLTQSDGIHSAKSPIGMFSDLLIDNDLNFVDAEIRDYYR